jgi:large subunit ribosomal protein L29
MPTAAELRELDDDELEERLGEYRKDLLNLRFQLATGQLDNAARVGQVRRDVARVMTLLRDREIALAEGRPVSGGGPVGVDAPAPRRARRDRVKAEDEFETEAEARAGATGEDDPGAAPDADGEDE